MEKIELISYSKKNNYNLWQTELDYYQHYILSQLFKKFNYIYFKGGTCLQKCYGIKRFSEDLDFNYTKDDINEIIKFIEDIFNKTIIDKYETKFGISFAIKFKGILYDGDIKSMCKISFDFRLNDKYMPEMKKIIRPIYKDLDSYFLLALNEEEILAEKVRAIITRYKARDVYDLNELLLNGIKIDLKLINQKLKTYEKTFNLNEFKEKIEEKRTIFNEEMKRLTNIFDSFENCKHNIIEQFQKIDK
jgi:predicted nucleotidyltransferase component of viral defense system